MTRDIIAADDFPAARKAVAAVLRGAGYRVREARDGDEAISMHRSEPCGLFVLDVMMPRKNGVDACRELRAAGDSTPVVFLTAMGGDGDTVAGLDAGADDYVPKTAPGEVLLARIAAVLRRVSPEAGGDFRFGPWTVEPGKGRMVSRSGGAENLSEREVALMRILASAPGEIFSKENLVARLWGLDSDVGDGALSQLVSRLRRKLGAAGGAVESVYSQGIRFAPGGAEGVAP